MENGIDIWLSECDKKNRLRLVWRMRLANRNQIHENKKYRIKISSLRQLVLLHTCYGWGIYLA